MGVTKIYKVHFKRREEEESMFIFVYRQLLFSKKTELAFIPNGDFLMIHDTKFRKITQQNFKIK